MGKNEIQLNKDLEELAALRQSDRGSPRIQELEASIKKLGSDIFNAKITLRDFGG